MDKRAVDTLIEQTYQSLPPKLQRAARYAIDNPKAMALNSMRSSAAEAGLPASAMHRLARTLGFDGYEAMRTVYRDWLAQGRGMFAERATALQKRGAANESERLVGDIVQAETLNLAQVTDPRTLAALKAAHDLLRSARHIHVAGLRSLFPAAFYFNYACNMFMPNVSLLSGVGGTFSDDLRHAGRDDVLVIFSYEPYARDSVSAARYARAQGMQIIAVTDSAGRPDRGAQCHAGVFPFGRSGHGDCTDPGGLAHCQWRASQSGRNRAQRNSATRFFCLLERSCLKRRQG